MAVLWRPKDGVRESKAFWKLSAVGDATSRGLSDSRSSVTLHVRAGFGLGELRGRVVDDWDPEAWMQVEPPGDLEDMPWPQGSWSVVTDRLREFFERTTPEHIQFLPIARVASPQKRKAKKAPVAYPTCWVANWIKVVDCMHPTLAEWGEPFDYGFGVRRSLSRVVVQSSRVPADVHVWRLKGNEQFVLVRDWLRRAIIDGGFTGCQFYEIEESIDP